MYIFVYACIPLHQVVIYAYNYIIIILYVVYIYVHTCAFRVSICVATGHSECT